MADDPVVALVAPRNSFEALVIVSAIDDGTPLCNGRSQSLHDMVASTLVMA